MHTEKEKGMGFFSKLLKKTPVNVTAHILDPDGVYQTKLWVGGSDVSDENASRLADGKNSIIRDIAPNAAYTVRFHTPDCPGCTSCFAYAENII